MKARRGMTVLELMIVLAIIGGGMFLLRTGFRAMTKADLVENSTELSAILRRTSQLAVETGQLHRVTFDLDKHVYAVEQCQGAATIQKNEALRPDDEKTKRAIEKGQERMKQVPADQMAGDPEAATRHAIAIAGHHIADRICVYVEEGLTGDVVKDSSPQKAWIRALRSGKGIKLKEIWVQHLEDSVTKGQVAIYFFPNGTAEKAVVYITDGSETFSVVVHGLTGRVVLKDGELRDPNDHMMKNVLGDKDKERDGEAAQQ